MFFAATLALLGLANAEEPEWKARLGQSLVSEQGGQWTWQSAQLCSHKKTGESFQIESKATAPADAGISRDVFLGFATQTQGLIMGMVVGVVAGASKNSDAFGDLECKRINAVIGKADVSLMLTMTADGWQLETTTGEKTDRRTMRWADTFAE